MLKLLLTIGALIGVYYTAKTCFEGCNTPQYVSPFEKAAPLTALFKASVAPASSSGSVFAASTQPAVATTTTTVSSPTYTPKSAWDLILHAASTQ